MDLKKAHQSGLLFSEYVEKWPDEILKTSDTELGQYVKINLSRNNRWVNRKPWRNFNAWQELPGTGIEEEWLVLTEYWCGDAAHIVPVIEDVAAVCGVQPRYIFRDENPEVMEQFTTNGSRSIPKLIRMTPDFEVINTWGPRPEIAQATYEQLKATTSDIHMILEEMQKWYNENKGLRVLNELVDLLKQ